MHGVQCKGVARESYTRSAEVTIKAQKSLCKVISHDVDKDLEVPYVTFKLTALADGAVADPQPRVLDRFFKVRITDNSRAHSFGDSLLLVPITDSVCRWTPKAPLILQRGVELEFSFVGCASFDIAFHGQRRCIDEIRIEVALEGEFLMPINNTTA